ncbi:MAG TPA: hypothetical protein VGR67_13015 [Candidatus Polarisedimenticolia bacterium]|jgi:hypothetical protein|nr:hypothetical protein [Candidatus Polarisedimenticolia bacterium]
MKEPLQDHDLVNAINSLKSIRIDLDEAARSRLVRRCRDTRGSRGWTLASFLASLQTSRVSFATATLALVLASGVALLSLNHSTNSSETVYSNDPVHLMSVTQASSGGVTLEWQDGNHKTYRVQKTTNPRNFTAAETYAVRGTRWTDSEPARGQVVYYRVQ